MNAGKRAFSSLLGTAVACGLLVAVAPAAQAGQKEHCTRYAFGWKEQMCLTVHWTRGIGYELNTFMTSTFNGHWKFTSNKGLEKVTEDLPKNKFMTVTAGKKHHSDVRFCAEALSKDGKGYRQVVKVCGDGPGK